MTGFSTSRSIRTAIRAFMALSHQGMVALLILGLSVPQLALAAGPQTKETAAQNVQPPVTEASPLEERILDGVAKATSPKSRLVLTAVERNIGFLNSQFLLDKNGNEIGQLGRLNVNRQKVIVPEGLAQHGLKAEAYYNEGEHSLRLKLDGYKETVELRFGRNQLVTSIVQTDEWLYFLMDDASLHGIELKEIHNFFFNTVVPVTFLGQGPVNGFLPKEIKRVQRRNIPADRSKNAQLRRFDLNPRTLEEAKEEATGALVRDMKAIAQEMRLPPLHSSLERKLREDLMASEGEAAADKVFDSLNVAIIGETDEGKCIIDFETRTETEAKAATQDSALMGLSFFSDPDSMADVEEMGAINETAATAISDLVNNPTNLQNLINSGLRESLGMLDKTAMRTRMRNSLAAMSKIAEAKKEGTKDALSDRFSYADLQSDLEYLNGTFIPEIETAAEYNDSLSKNIFARMTRAVVKKVKKFDIVKRMNNVVRTMAKPTVITAGVGAAAYAVDQRFFDGHGTAFSADLALGFWNWVKMHTTLQNMSYTVDMVTHSFPFRAALIAAVFAGAALAKPFSQHSRATLMTIAGIKYLFSFAMYPVTRIVPKFTGRMGFVEAAREGKFAGRYLVPFSFLFGGKEKYAEKVSEQIRNRDDAQTIAGAVAIASWAASRNQTPFEALMTLAQGQEDSEANRIRLSNLMVAVTDLVTPKGIINKDPRYAHKVAAAVNSSPEVFEKMFAELRAATDTALKNKGDVTPGILPQVRLYFLKALLEKYAQFGEETYKTVANPMPDETTSGIIARSLAVDGLFTIAISGMMGDWANFHEPENLSYRPQLFEMKDMSVGEPGSLIYTNPMAVVQDLEQVYLHLGAMAAGLVTAVAREGKALFRTSGPASAVDFDRETGRNTFFKDAKLMLKEMLNIRKNNPLDAIGMRSWKQCVTLFPGMFVVGMGLRLINGMMEGGLTPSYDAFMTDPNYLATFSALWGKALTDATIGQIFFLFVAPFAYRWFWGFNQVHMAGLEGTLKEMGEKYQKQYLLLAQALKQKDLPMGQAAAKQIIEMYQQEHRALDPKLRAALDQHEGEDTIVWIERVLKVCQEQAPVAEKPNELLAKGYVLVGSVITTVLAIYLMTASFAERSFWGNPAADLSNTVDLGNASVNSAVNSTLDSLDQTARDLNLDPTKVFIWKGLAEHNSLPLVAAKSVAYVMAMMATGRLLNVGLDQTRLTYRKVMDNLFGAHNRPRPEGKSDEKLVEQRNQALQSVGEIPLVPEIRKALKAASRQVFGASLGSGEAAKNQKLNTDVDEACSAAVLKSHGVQAAAPPSEATN